jgi:hypothetical protein
VEERGESHLGGAMHQRRLNARNGERFEVFAGSTCYLVSVIRAFHILSGNSKSLKTPNVTVALQIKVVIHSSLNRSSSDNNVTFFLGQELSNKPLAA